MSVDEALKRKSPEEDPSGNVEDSDEPQAKVIKSDSGTVQPNLKSETLLTIIEETNAGQTANEEESQLAAEIEDVKTTIEATDTSVNTTVEIEEAKPPTETTTVNGDVGPTIEVPDTGPSITIKFQNDFISDMYKSKFLQFIATFAELEVRYDDRGCIEVYRDEAKKSELNGSDQSPAKKRRKHSKVKKELFVVDATSSPVRADLLYTTKFTVNTEKEEKCELGPKQSTCFNCNEAHMLRDCPLPKDYRKINELRQKFRAQPKLGRYHLEEDQKFSHLAPGRISNELRRALGLHKDEAPHYIYMMRRLGYPPGWLEEAKFVHSNLDLFDIDGKNVKTKTVKSRGLDPDKVVSYPGFNVPFDKGIKDDFHSYRVQPFSEDCSKEAMINYFSKNIAEGDSKIGSVNQEETPGGDSPSLIDLEQQKQELLKELNEPKEETKGEAVLDRDFLTVKTTCFGTPLLKSSSPYATLPNPDNFSKDVSPVINFENLPNSTGKYEQMTDILQKVRSALKGVHNCNT